MKFVENDGLVALANLLKSWMESKEAESGVVVVLKVRSKVVALSRAKLLGLSLHILTGLYV